MDDVACTGTESNLIDCNFDNNTGDCSHSEDAGVRCFYPPTTGENSVYRELEYMSEEQYGFIVNITLICYFQKRRLAKFTGSYMCVTVAQCNFAN